MVLAETWLMSTIMPNLFISLTISSPKLDRPAFVSGSLPSSATEESALGENYRRKSSINDQSVFMMAAHSFDFSTAPFWRAMVCYLFTTQF